MKGNNMKMIAKIAACGLLTFSLSAFAQTAQLAPTAAKLIKSSPTAQRFASETVGAKIGADSAALTKALEALPAGAQALAISKLNSYASQASAGTSETAKLANEAVAAGIFMSEGKLLTVAKLNEQSAARDASKTAGNCSSVVDAHAMAQKARSVNFTRIQEAIAKGNIVRGTCGEILEEMKEQAVDNAAQIGDCMTTKGAEKLVGTQAHTDIVVGCTMQALNDDPGAAPIDLVAAAAKENSVAEKCGFFNGKGQGLRRASR